MPKLHNDQRASRMKTFDIAFGCFLFDFQMFLLKSALYTQDTRVDSNSTKPRKNKLTGTA